MKEEFLHYLWKYSLYDSDRLYDAEGNRIDVIHPGTYNRDSGPDFFNARIRISGTVWAGNVEIHAEASEFNLHRHQYDPAYDNVILHVVTRNDCKVFNTKGEEIPAVEIVFDPALYERYSDLVNNPCSIACQDHAGNLDRMLVHQWLYSLAVERLEMKADSILRILKDTGNDWEETFYRLMCRYFGFRVNTEPFEMLSGTLPLKIVRKHADNLLQVEALLFGAAGMLEEGLFREALDDEYYITLVREYKILSAKYSFRPVHGWLWKFARLRPMNFPTIRISQLASMLVVSGGLFSRVIETEDVSALKGIFEVNSSEYWDDHFVFGRKSRSFKKQTGSLATDILLINAVIPALFVYGKERGRDELCERAMNFLEDTGPEKNKITEEWKIAGIDAFSAFETQALLQLRNEYCRKRRCLECRFGNKIISEGRRLKKDDQLLLEPQADFSE